MPNGDDKIGTIVADPDFQGLGLADQQKFLSRVDPDFGKLDTGSFSTFLARYKGQSQTGAPTAKSVSWEIQAPDAVPSTISARPSLGSRLVSSFKEGGVAGIGQELGESTRQAVGNLPLPGVNKTVGQGLTDLGQMANMAGSTAASLFGGPGAAEILPSTARAGKAIQSVTSAIGSHPVDVSKAGDAALKAWELGRQGGGKIQAIEDFVRRVADPKKGPLTFAEARNFYSNLKPSILERLTTKGSVKAMATQFKIALGQALEDTATRGGQIETYMNAMKEYHNAARLKAVAALGGATALKKTVGTIGGWEMLKELIK